MCTVEENAKPKTIEEVWTAALEFAQNDERVWADVERARALDPAQTSESDFLRECTWAIFGARFPYKALARRWPALEEAFCNWRVADIVAQRETVRADALKILNHKGKIDAVLEIAQWLNAQEWCAVHKQILGLCERDRRGDLVVTDDLIKWLDKRPYVGPTLAAYIAKDVGIGSVKDDKWMCRLAGHLGYIRNTTGVWRMARDVQVFADEKLNVIDTVLWNWAMKQEWLKESECCDPAPSS